MQVYRGNELVIRYDPAVCTHAAECVKGLPAVFDVGKTPWVNASGAAVEVIKQQIERCPSGALSYETSQEL